MTQAGGSSHDMTGTSGAYRTAGCNLTIGDSLTEGKSRIQGGKLTTVIFVHGTGVREPAFSTTFARIGAELRLRSPEIDVEPCYWGEAAGARLWHGGASVPSYDTTRGIAPDDEEEEIALWSILYQDPLWELRMLALAGPPGGELPPGRLPPGDVLDAAARTLEPSGELAAAVQEAGLAATFWPAREVIVSAAPYRGAVAAAGDSLGGLRLAVARAIVAEALAEQGALEGSAVAAVPDAAARDRVIVLLTDALGGQERGVTELIGASVRGVVLRPATALAVRRRGAITDATTPAAGDILLYQSRGAAIRDFIANAVTRTDGQAVLIAHSLGGIAAVDLLAGRSFPKVGLLVTVGSQAPLLYEIGAQVSLRHHDPLPAHFPPWLNIYDLHDLLSYIAEPLFPGRVTDVEVRNGQPFPQSHSAYWANPAVWDAVTARLP